MPLVDYRAAVIKRLVFVRSTLSQGHENHRMVPKGLVVYSLLKIATFR
jgi:hypothetical protein